MNTFGAYSLLGLAMLVGVAYAVQQVWQAPFPVLGQVALTLAIIGCGLPLGIVCFVSDWTDG